MRDLGPFGDWLAGFIDGEGCFLIPYRWGTVQRGGPVASRDNSAVWARMATLAAELREGRRYLEAA
jgi:hypothetical protein